MPKLGKKNLKVEKKRKYNIIMLFRYIQTNNPKK